MLTNDDTPAARPRPRKLLWLALLALALLALAASRRFLAYIPHRLAGRQLAADRLADARWWLQVAQRLAGDHPDTALYQSRLARKAGDLQRARQCLDRAKELGLDEDRVTLEEVLIRAQSGEIQQVRHLLGRLLEVSQDQTPEISEAFVRGFMKTHISVRLGIDLLNSWVADYPQDPRPHQLLAELSLEIMDIDNAERELRLALGVDPDYGPAALALGKLLLNQQELDEALPLFRTAAQFETTRPAALVGQAKCLRTVGRNADAQEIVTAALQEDPDSPAANIEQAELDLAAGRFEAAAERLQDVLSREPHQHQARFALAAALRSLARADEARRQHARASQGTAALIRAQHLVRDLVLDPNNVDLRVEIGQIHRQHGQRQQALDWLRSALMLDPQHQPARQIMNEIDAAPS